MIIKCRSCNQNQNILVTAAMLKAWNSGILIQNAMPELSPGDRELLISGICSTCFDKIFSEKEY